MMHGRKRRTPAVPGDSTLPAASEGGRPSSVDLAGYDPSPCAAEAGDHPDAGPGRLQRRRYFRMRIRLPMTVRVRMEQGGQPEGGTGEEAGRKVIRAFRVLDLSAGGCLCEDPDLFLEAGKTYKASLQLNDRENALDLLARVVRRSGGNAGIAFDEMSEKDRENIMRALFREYRRRRSRETRGGGEG